MRWRVKDISGLRSGMLVATDYLGVDDKGKSLWRCQCDCGGSVVRNGFAISRAAKRGVKSHCGCSPFLKTHGITSRNKRLYSVWGAMVQRCENPSNKDYPNYGGRGISMCHSWRSAYDEFYRWAIETGYAPGMTIERVDVNDGYHPGNCCWTPNARQSLNTRRSFMIEFNGKTQHISDWARDVGISPRTIKTRLVALGWDVNRALNEKPRKGKNQYEK